MRYITTLAVTTAISTLTFGQVTLQSSDINPVVGDVFTVKNATHMPEGNAGDNVTWDFSTMQSIGDLNISHNSPSAAFPASNIDQVTNDGAQTNNVYLQADASGQFFHGVEGAGILISYQTPEKVLTFPLNSSVNESNNYAATFTVSGINFSRSGTTQIEADGYGTIITPEGTFTDVIRVKITRTIVDTYIGGTINTSMETFAWYKAGYHYAILSVSTVTTDQGDQLSGQYLSLDGLSVGLEEASNETISIFPNPSESTITVELNDQTNASSIELINSLGQKVKELNIVSNKMIVNVESLETGVYFVSIKDEDGIVISTKRIVKK